MKTITVAYGDGIGHEIMESVLQILNVANAQIRVDAVDIGKDMYEKGWASGIPDSAWSVIRRNKVLLKAPITTPRGEGYQSLNVKLRKTLGLYANVRPCISYTNKKGIDIVVVRENEEDLYVGVEYHQTLDGYHSIKFTNYSVSRRICRYAFEYAKSEKRKKVTCLVKDNIMKMTDGTFHRAFKEVAADYPEIEAESMLLDIGMARVAVNPAYFDVIVTTNLYGDVVSDVIAEVAGSVGMGASLNIGESYAMFEAIHGSAPDIAGKNIANPSGLLNAAIYMLSYLGQIDVAAKIYNAWRKTLAQGFHTADIFEEGVSQQQLSTTDFTEAVIDNIGCDESFSFGGADLSKVGALEFEKAKVAERTLIGIDVFIFWQESSFESAVAKLKTIAQNFACDAQLISKGMVLWPSNTVAPGEVRFADSLCCRLVLHDHSARFRHEQVVEVLAAFHEASMEVVKLEKLYLFQGKPGFSIFVA